jgi:hypothetical protein
MNATFRQSQEIDGQLLLVSLFSSDTDEIDVLKKLYNELTWCKDSITDCRFNYIPRGNYFGVEVTYTDHNGTVFHLLVYTKFAEGNTYMPRIISVLQEL